MKALLLIPLLSPLLLAASGAGDLPRFDQALPAPALSLQEQIRQGSLLDRFSGSRATPQMILQHAAPEGKPPAARAGRMPVIEPDSTIDYKMRVKRPDSSVEYSMLDREVESPRRPRPPRR